MLGLHVTDIPVDGPVDPSFVTSSTYVVVMCTIILWTIVRGAFATFTCCPRVVPTGTFNIPGGTFNAKSRTETLRSNMWDRVPDVPLMMTS